MTQLEDSLVTAAVGRLRAGPSSLAVLADEVIVRGRFAGTLARAIDPEFAWLELRPHDDPSPAPEAGLLEEIGEDHVTVVDPSDFRLQTDLGNLAAWAAHRGGGVSGEAAKTVDFVYLPETAQRLLTSRAPNGPAGAIVIANAERARSGWEGTAGSLRPYISLLNGLRFTVVVTSWLHARENVADFEYTLRIKASEAPTSRALEVRCTRGSASPADGLLCQGVSASYPRILAHLAAASLRMSDSH